MKRLIYSVAILFGAFSVFAQNTETHAGKILGTVDLDAVEVTSVYDEVTNLYGKRLFIQKIYFPLTNL